MSTILNLRYENNKKQQILIRSNKEPMSGNKRYTQR